MWWVNIAFGIFAALVHVQISNEPYVELPKAHTTKTTNREAQATTNSAAAKVGNETNDSKP